MASSRPQWATSQQPRTSSASRWQPQYLQPHRRRTEVVRDWSSYYAASGASRWQSVREVGATAAAAVDDPIHSKKMVTSSRWAHQVMSRRRSDRARGLKQKNWHSCGRCQPCDARIPHKRRLTMSDLVDFQLAVSRETSVSMLSRRHPLVHHSHD